MPIHVAYIKCHRCQEVVIYIGEAPSGSDFLEKIGRAVKEGESREVERLPSPSSDEWHVVTIKGTS